MDLDAQRIRLIGAFLVGAVLVLFAVLNLDEVDVNWIVGTWQTPLIVVIVVSMAFGAVSGVAIARHRATRPQREGAPR